MEITCPSCRKKLAIPDDKIPHGQRVSFACPQCRERVVVEPPKEEQPPPAPLAPDIQEGGKGVFLLVGGEDALLRGVEKALKDLGYHCVAAEGEDTAVRRLQLRFFEGVVLFHGAAAPSLEGSKVRAYLGAISSEDRRRVVLCVVGEGFQTLDAMTAFSLSVDAVISTADRESLRPVFERILVEHASFHKVFSDTLKELGKL